MDQTTESFLNALKRSRRGKPSKIYSENGANNHFLELHKLISSKKHNQTVIDFLANDHIQWHFIPARSSPRRRSLGSYRKVHKFSFKASFREFSGFLLRNVHCSRSN